MHTFFRCRWCLKVLTGGGLLLQTQGCAIDTDVLVADLTQAALTVLLDTMVGALSQAIG